MPIAVIYIVAGILFLDAAPLHLPFGYYTMVKIVAMGAFIWAFLIAFNRNATFLPWIYLLFAATYNPVMKVPLPLDLWMIVDIAAGTLLIFTQNKIKQQASTKII
jgi:hypothetical protein